jgi:lysozyme
MQLSGAGLELLKRAEGFRERVYLDLAGLQTIGFGHRLLPGESYPSGISVAQGEAILAGDVCTAALVDFVFNLGAGRLASSTLLRYLNQGKYDSAAWQLLAWDHVGMREVASLKSRREAEFQLWGTDAAQKQAAA